MTERFIDAHHHLWDLNACHYPWLMARGETRFFGDPSAIQKDYLVSDFQSESRHWTPRQSVHIQVGVANADIINETRWLQSVAQAPGQAGLPQAIVAFCDLAATDAVSVLEQQLQYSNVRGIRHIVGRHADEDRINGSQQLLENQLWLQNLSQLPSYCLSFDLQLIPPQLDRVFNLLKQIPDLSVALCHCGSPWDQTEQGLQQWRSGLRQLAQLPNLCCKISGLAMFRKQWSVAMVRRIALEVIDIFGPERCMFGSNFPVDKLYTTYDRIWNTYAMIANEFSEQEAHSMFYETATRFYRL